MIWEWLLAPIDNGRAHDVGFLLSWHARIMIFTWGGFIPFSIVVARYYKILPWQNWPKKLDSQFWWIVHGFGQFFAYLLCLVGLYLVLMIPPSDLPSNPHASGYDIHRFMGYSVIALGAIQVLLGLFRGTKGGPTDMRDDGSLAGDHYDMTPRRIMFEHLHRSFGYLVLALAIVAILFGLWTANAPHWMWIVIISWWLLLGWFSIYMQLKGRAFDTYQAIWGADADLPGNKRNKMGWGTVRPSEKLRHSNKGEK